jgi:hypothetical protein
MRRLYKEPEESRNTANIMYTMRPLSADDYPQWNRLIAESPHGKTFLRAEWLHMLAETDSQYHAMILGCFDSEGRLAGGQAVCYQQRWDLRIVNGFEFLYSGPVLAKSVQHCNATRSAKYYEVLGTIGKAMSEQFASVACETQPTLTDVRPLLYDGWAATPVYSHMWRVGDSEYAWSNMNHAKRNQIRHMQKRYRFDIEESTAAVDSFVGLYRDTMTKFGWRPSLRWEGILHERFHWMRQRDGCRLYTVREPGGAMVGGVVAILSPDDHTALLWRVGTRPDFTDAGGAPALYWHAACELSAEFPDVDFGWSPQSSLSHFKDYMGATAELHFRATQCNQRARLALLNGAQRAKDAIYNWMRPLAYGSWQRLRYGRRQVPMADSA